MGSCCHDRRLIGEVLLERGLIQDAELQQALSVQKKHGADYLGGILVKLGFAREIDVVTALMVQCNLPYISISKYSVPADVAALIPASMARSNCFVPLDKIGNVLSLVMQNPLEEKLRREVEKITGCYIAIFVSTRREIEQALARLYPTGGC
ncbi:MAG: hypothetical protein V2A70_02020 [Candidatus Omnitrophota bacterium]